MEADDSASRSHSALNLPNLCFVYETLMPNDPANRGVGVMKYTAVLQHGVSHTNRDLISLPFFFLFFSYPFFFIFTLLFQGFG